MQPVHELHRNQSLHSHALFFDPVLRKVDWSQVDAELNKVPYIEEKPGVTVLANGDVVFYFLAPNAESVQVAHMGGPRCDLRPCGDGYWTVTLSGIPAGFHYHHYYVNGIMVTNPLSPYGYGSFQPINYYEIPDSENDFYLLQPVPHGSIRMELYESSVTGRTRNCWVYTPPGYDQQLEHTYPVLYLQHGGGENETGWLWQGKIHYILDNLIAAGQCEEMVVVMNSGYAFLDEEMSQFLPGNFDAVLMEDCIPFIENRFRVKTDRLHRAMAGLSMGAFQTLLTTFKHIEDFAWIGLFSGSLACKSSSEYDHRKLFEHPEAFNDAVKLLFLGMGEQEHGYDPIVREHRELTDRGIRSVLYTCPGGHDWHVWRRSVHAFLQRVFRT
ncbi:enterochelin esterase-like enzyme [Paenibacillus phyllosphaerae]|uniref:Enterochelin esterase-like enzyme n=1 Tax=Paenibacillus phyllosphaerae TaxID=274593 RepID=A0A7W5ASZ0_9BACL|nr:alpha/beta hydrolase-fold protein [Paenibacillus phyllosphaerae]MBB3108047.1 enterochelin esterase-like enzyme [Paenibacillus phyllosphaerae]